MSQGKVKVYERQNIPRPGNPVVNEAWALLEVARRIAAVVQFGDLTKPEDKKKVREALRLNLRIWTIIQAEQTIQEAEGKAAELSDLRRNILTLCKFIDQHTMSTMIEPTVERLVVLININRNIAAGLLGSVSDDDVPPATEEGAGAADEKKDFTPLKTSI